mgnify:CR=1 FL=1
MARAVLFGTPVSPGIAIGRVRFMHKARQDDERRITAADVAAEQETLRAAAPTLEAAGLPAAAADVAVLIAGQDLQIHRVHRDEELIAKLIELEAQFWWHVENNIPPPADGSDSAAQALQILFQQDNGQILG